MDSTEKDEDTKMETTSLVEYSNDILIEMLQNSKCKDKTSIEIILNARGYRISEKNGKIKAYKKKTKKITK